MKASSVDFRSAAIFGLLLSLPFAVLELAFRGFVRPDPRFVLGLHWLLGLLALFGFLWTLPFVFAFLGQSLLREGRIDPRRLARPPMMASVVVLVLIAALWGIRLRPASLFSGGSQLRLAGSRNRPPRP